MCRGSGHVTTGERPDRCAREPRMPRRWGRPDGPSPGASRGGAASSLRVSPRTAQQSHAAEAGTRGENSVTTRAEGHAEDGRVTAGGTTQGQGRPAGGRRPKLRERPERGALRASAGAGPPHLDPGLPQLRREALNPGRAELLLTLLCRGHRTRFIKRLVSGLGTQRRPPPEQDIEPGAGVGVPGRGGGGAGAAPPQQPLVEAVRTTALLRPNGSGVSSF